MLTDKDREFLIQACEMAEEARKPTSALGQKPEPVWAALLATSDRKIVASVFLPGDKCDAVRVILDKVKSFSNSSEDLTLYLTLEPRASFTRLPPVTESVRLLGVKRVVIGSEDPSQRLKGEGRKTLERMGIQVLLADGEAARRCQDLLDDYATVIQKGLAVLRVRGALNILDESSYSLSLDNPDSKDHPDAILYGANETRLQKKENAWSVILDPEGKHINIQDRSIIFQDAGNAKATNARTLNYRDGRPDLGALLRELAGLGILSVELSRDPLLFREALEAGLIDSLVLDLPEDCESSSSISKISKVRFSDGGESIDLKLSSVRFKDARSLVARVELC